MSFRNDPSKVSTVQSKSDRMLAGLSPDVDHIIVKQMNTTITYILANLIRTHPWSIERDGRSKTWKWSHWFGISSQCCRKTCRGSLIRAGRTNQACDLEMRLAYRYLCILPRVFLFLFFLKKGPFVWVFSASLSHLHEVVSIWAEPALGLQAAASKLWWRHRSPFQAGKR